MTVSQYVLPDSKSPALALVQPTDAEKIEQFKKNGLTWKGALSLDAYLRREEFLSQQAFTRDGGITYWVLVDSAAKDRVVLSGCETLRKKALVARDGKVEEVVSHGVGSVFCPPEYRNRGYAARMMEELGRKLETWQTDQQRCMFTVLYSDIGKTGLFTEDEQEFYTARGWHPFPSSHVSVPATSKPEVHVGTLPQSRPLHAADLAELCAIDEGLIRERMTRSSSDGRWTAALIPDVDVIQWHHAREEFVAKELYGRTPVVKGAIVDNKPGHRVWCYWTRMWYNDDPQENKDNTLHILRLVSEGESLSEGHPPDANHQTNGHSSIAPAIASLLAAAQQEASQWTMGDVEIWNPTCVTIEAAQHLDPAAEVTHRDKESIASLRWYGENPDRPAEHVNWIGNEKYGWC
ncbi:hypothetical protein LTR04_001270 [Oleoguttula sp. CCFEE 6159]|nr:hypothetical protein LTR04_001270 [Oleoguttula sp. CCFEE 6159]